MKALDQRLLAYARATRTFLFLSVALGVLSALLIVAQAWLLADVVARAFLGGEGLAATANPADRAAARRPGARDRRVGGRARGEPLLGAREVAAARGPAGARRDARPGQLARAAHRRARGPRHARDRRARRLLLAVPAAAVPRRDRAGRRRRGRPLERLDLGGDHRVHDPADPAVHGAGGRRDEGTHGQPVPHPGATRRPLPRRRRRTADAEGLRAGQGAGAGDPRDHRTLPPGGDRNAADHVPLLADPRARRDDLGGARGGRDRPAADGRPARSAHRAVRARARARGLPAAAPARRQLPRERRGHRRRRAGVRRAGGARAAARHAHRLPRPGARGPHRRGAAGQLPRPLRAGARRRFADDQRRARCWRSSAPAAAASRPCSACCSGSSHPSSGRSASADVDLAELDLDAWRARLAWVPQRPHLFKASIAQNVRLGRSRRIDRAGLGGDRARPA